MHLFTILILSIISMVVPTEKKKTVLFFGDSITELGVKEKGYISVLQEKLKAEGKEGAYELVGSGIGGNKIYDLYFRHEKDVLAKNPDIVVIWIGVNDVWHKSTSGTGSDLHKFEPMYVDLIQKLVARGIQVYCATPACIGEKTDFSNAQDGDLNEFSKAIRKIAKNNQAGLLDFRQLFLDYNLKHNPKNLPNGILTYDGVHLNDDGNVLVADVVWKQVLFPLR
jgi:lysophospholipase L1-like esterase